MDITVTEVNEATVLKLSGRLDLASGSDLKHRVKELFDKDYNSFHFNMCDIEFVNSSGLGTLVSIMKEVRLRKGRLTLSDLASYVQEIFDITQLSHIFEIYGTQAEALSSYKTTSVG
ncbi:MAG: STAS domain-containing protein [bacterium]